MFRNIFSRFVDRTYISKPRVRLYTNAMQRRQIRSVFTPVKCSRCKSIFSRVNGRNGDYKENLYILCCTIEVLSRKVNLWNTHLESNRCLEQNRRKFFKRCEVLLGGIFTRDLSQIPYDFTVSNRSDSIVSQLRKKSFKLQLRMNFNCFRTTSLVVVILH